jgi:glucoamylase
MAPVVPDPEYPEYTAYWVRDGCHVYYTWLNELTVHGPHDDTTPLRALVDDGVHALIRTQQIVSLSGNIFTGGLEEPVFDLHLNKLSDTASRVGSPAAGATSTRYLFRRKCLQ